ncbi:hypothetical protein G7066_08745 [Leucobacter coleopterorum]|uniref:Uncharacterized protein n=1 Tax=Leucobacter coleopterorum TaxID=2714933 RepID=A0ABX6JWQ3_9MICO|nr:hypothetical protein [Leucobacter coleopterorum]QIM18677.1 hypothetical protein G7066_08745 [Leucobacter coleopterorum]
MAKLIAVTTPRFWWRTTPSQVRHWVPKDPDVEDRKQRHLDRDDQRWARIASAVAQVGEKLATGDWQVESEHPTHGFVALDEYPGELTQTEQDIVSSWFTTAEAVRFDPWFEPLTNGRHRLWQTMPHFGTGSIPILGDTLGYANPVDTKALGDVWPKMYAQNLEELDSLDWFDAKDPLNIAFRNSLATATSGEIPSATTAIPSPAPIRRLRWQFWTR